MVNLIIEVIKEYNIRHNDSLDSNLIASAFDRIHNTRLIEERDLLIEFSGYLMGRGDSALLNMLYVQELIAERTK